MLAYKADHPNAKTVQFDTVEGIKGGKCLFTIHFPTMSYMIAFLIESQKANIIVPNFWRKVIGFSKISCKIKSVGLL